MIPHHVTGFKADGTKVYKDKRGNVLVNPANGEPLEPIPVVLEGDIGMPAIGKFRSSTPEQKRAMLQKRSWKHANSPEMLDRRAEVNATQKPKGTGA